MARKPSEGPSSPAFEAGVYEHHRGGTYTAFQVVQDSTNGREGRWVVWYFSHKLGTFRSRDYHEWSAHVRWPDGEFRPRFDLVEPKPELALTINKLGREGGDGP